MVAEVYIKIIGQLILSMLIIYIAFGDEGIVSNTTVYISRLEPIIMQNFLVSSLVVGAETPGYFSSSFETSGDPHKILVSAEDEIKYLKVEPAKSISFNTKFKDHTRAELSIGNCIISNEYIQLKPVKQTVTVSKMVNANGECVLDIQASD